MSATQRRVACRDHTPPPPHTVTGDHNPMAAITHRQTEATITRLAAIPHLAAEAWATWGTQAASDDGDRRPASRAHSPALADLDRIVLLATPGDEGLGVLQSWCRMIWEERGLPATIETLPHDTIDDACQWLALRLDWAAGFEWADCLHDEIRDLWAALRRLCRYTDAPRYTCPSCGAQMHIQTGGQWFLCDEGHQHSTDVERTYRRRPALPTRLICGEFQITEERLWQWHRRRKIKPARREGRVCYWLPWDVFCALNPHLKRLIDERDTLAREAS